jgi:hypothetical protein
MVNAGLSQLYVLIDTALPESERMMKHNTDAGAGSAPPTPPLLTHQSRPHKRAEAIEAAATLQIPTRGWGTAKDLANPASVSTTWLNDRCDVKTVNDLCLHVWNVEG